MYWLPQLCSPKNSPASLPFPLPPSGARCRYLCFTGREAEVEYFAAVAQEISREPEGGRGKQALHWEVRALSPSSSSGSGGVH